MSGETEGASDGQVLARWTSAGLITITVGVPKLVDLRNTDSRYLE